MQSRAQLEAQLRSNERLRQALETLLAHRPLAEVRPALLAEYKRLTAIAAVYLDDYERT